MSVKVHCDLCGNTILPEGNDGDIHGSGVDWWGNRYETLRLQRKRWFRAGRKQNEWVDVQEIDAHIDCVTKLFAAERAQGTNIMSTTRRPQTGWVKTCAHCGLRTPAHNDYPACIHCTKRQDTDQ